MNKNYYSYFIPFIGINNFLKICSNGFRFSTDTFSTYVLSKSPPHVHCLESHQLNLKHGTETWRFHFAVSGNRV